MTHSGLRTVVLLPTYNEIDNLEAITQAILREAPVDICILDDASPDGTGQLANKIASSHSQVQVLHGPEKQGLGKAYIEGFRFAISKGYDRIIQMDADFSHPPAKLPEMLELSMAYDLVIGSRWVPGGCAKNWSVKRELISKAGSLYARMILGGPIRDMTGGFKCFRRQVIENMNIDEITSTGYVFQIETLYRARHHGFSSIETPIVFVDRVFGESKMARHIVFEALMRVPMLKGQYEARKLREKWWPEHPS